MAHRRQRPDDDALYRIAEAQAGYFTTQQARRAGFSAERLTGNTRSGVFHRIAPGVYRLTHFPASRFEDLFAAWLMAGPRSVISHESALAVFDLSDILPGKIHLIIPRTSSRRHPGLQLHTHHLEPGDITSREGLPVTAPVRTLLDVAQSGLSAELLEQAIQEAIRRGLVARSDLVAQARRRRGRAGQIVARIGES